MPLSLCLTAKDDNLSGIVDITVIAKPEWLNVTSSTPGNPANIILEGTPLQAGNFELSFSLTDGVNTAAYSKDIIVAMDEPPVIIITSPIEGGMHYTPSVLVTGAVYEDTSSVASVFINGNEVEVINEVEFSYLLLPLIPEENTITITAEDEAGNIGTATVTITYTPSTEVEPGQSIQEAIDDQESLPVIYVRDGTYTEDIYMKAGKALIGESLNTVIKGHVIFKEANTSIETFTIKYPEEICIDFISGNGAYQNLRVMADGAVTAINSEITVKGCIIMPYQSEGIEPISSEVITFGKGIQIWNLYGNPDIAPMIENCDIRNADTGIYLFSQAFGGAILGEIKENILDHNNDGILLRMHKEKPIISDNEITNSINGIHITYEDGLLLQERLNNITGNAFTDNKYNIFCDELGE